MEKDRLEQLKEMLKSMPDDAFVLFALAKEHEKLFEHTEALSVYKVLFQTHPLYTGQYFHFASLLLSLGNQTEAQQVMLTGLEICREKGQAHDFRELSALYQQNGFSDDAI